MNPRTLILAFVALSLAGLTALFARHWLDAQRVVVAAPAPAPAPSPGIEVLVAREALPTGTFVKPEQLRWQAWPEKGLNQAYIVKGKGDMNAFVGGVVRQLIAAGEPITAARIVTPGDRGFLAAVLKPGMRAVSVSINAETGISGLVFPGDRVDLIVAQKFKQKNALPGQAEERRASETVLEDVRVLAIDQNTKDGNEKPAVAKTVTLEVTPKQAESIAVAIELGKLSLSLRPLATAEEGIATVSEPRSGTWDKEVSEAIWRTVTSDPITIMHGSKLEFVSVNGAVGSSSAPAQEDVQ
jgi:pilus assembly protein CpaB